MTKWTFPKYLDEYKSYPEDQRDALKKSLDKRKEAYSDYFESINQQADDEDFDIADDFDDDYGDGNSDEY